MCVRGGYYLIKDVLIFFWKKPRLIKVEVALKPCFLLFARRISCESQLKRKRMHGKIGKIETIVLQAS